MSTTVSNLFFAALSDLVEQAAEAGVLLSIERIPTGAPHMGRVRMEVGAWVPRINDEAAAAWEAQADSSSYDMVKATQDPKYSILQGRLVNAASLERIPADEPVFMFRGRDRHALEALWPYLDACAPGPHRDAIRKSIGRFEDFAGAHPERMKEPDTAPVLIEGATK